MRVRLCNRCPYTPRDLADHYDSAAALYACARCDGEVGILNPSDSWKAKGRQPCATAFHTGSTTTQPSAAPFAKDGLAWFAITHGEPPCAPRDASIASSSAGRPTANGCADFAPPDAHLGEPIGLCDGSGTRNREHLR